VFVLRILWVCCCYEEDGFAFLKDWVCGCMRANMFQVNYTHFDSVVVASSDPE